MTSEGTLSRVRTVTSKLLRIAEDGIHSDSRLVEDLSADSLYMAQLEVALEDEFEIVLDDMIQTRLFTINDIVDFVNVKLEKK